MRGCGAEEAEEYVFNEVGPKPTSHLRPCGDALKTYLEAFDAPPHGAFLWGLGLSDSTPWGVIGHVHTLRSPVHALLLIIVVQCRKESIQVVRGFCATCMLSIEFLSPRPGVRV